MQGEELASALQRVNFQGNIHTHAVVASRFSKKRPRILRMETHGVLRIRTRTFPGGQVSNVSDSPKTHHPPPSDVPASRQALDFVLPSSTLHFHMEVTLTNSLSCKVREI